MKNNNTRTQPTSIRIQISLDDDRYGAVVDTHVRKDDVGWVCYELRELHERYRIYTIALVESSDDEGPLLLTDRDNVAVAAPDWVPDGWFTDRAEADLFYEATWTADRAGLASYTERA